MTGVLSGSLPDVIVATRWKLSLDWTATQDIDKNQSTVTAKMYWESTDSYGEIDSTATKESGIQHDDGSWSTESPTAGLSANQKKLINTYQFTLTHDSDGTKTFSLDGYFDAQVTLSGTYYGTINMTQTNFTLKTIPRASTLTGGQSWTAGSNTTFTVDRASTSFTHDIKIEVGNGSTYNTIKTLTGVGTSASSSFSGVGGDNENIFIALNGAASRTTKITLTTKDSGGNVIGSNVYTDGTCTAPAVDTIAVSDFNVGATVPITVTEANSSFSVSITATIGSYTAPAIATKSTSLSFNWDTSAVASSIYGQMTTVNSKSCTFTITTYYGNTVVRSATTKVVNAKVVNSNPTFTTFTYSDTNTTTSALTNPYQGASTPFIIQTKSALRVSVLSANKAVGVNQATISKYVFTVNGTPKTFNSPFSTDIIWDFGAITATANFNITVSVYDSRNNVTTVTKVCNVVPWSKPVVNATAVRTGGYQAETTLTVSGSISPLVVNGTTINAVLTPVANTYYTYAVSGASQGAGIALTGITGVPNYTTTNQLINSPTGLDNTKSYVVVVTVSDKLDSTQVTINVPNGKPIFFIDDVLQSLGFGDYPANANEFMMSGTLRFAHNLFNGAGGIDMNNSDITNINHLQIADGGGSEGLEWLGADNWKIVQAPDDLSNPSDGHGDLQFVRSGVRKGSFYTSGLNIAGTNLNIEGGNSVVVAEAGYIVVRAGLTSAVHDIVYLQGSEVRVTEVSTTGTYMPLTAGTITAKGTGDSLVLQSDDSANSYNAGNVLWKSQSGQSLGRMHYYGTGLADLKAYITMYDDAGTENNMIIMNASGANYLTFNGDILPDSDNSRQLGNLTTRFQGVYLANLGGVYWSNDDSLKYDDSTNTFTFAADAGANATVTCKTLTQTSDAQLKQNFQIPSWKAVDEINKMDVRQYEFITDDTNEYLGVVIGAFDGGDGYVNPLLEVTNPDGYATMNLYGLAAMNTMAIQELDARLKKLEGVA